jgi:hypothetical protein
MNTNSGASSTNDLGSEKKPSPRKISKKSIQPKLGQIPDHELHKLISTEAYLIAEKRGFETGREMEDWLEAEKIVRSFIY